ncbi:MAG: DUF6573 family protein [Planctomycetota bacterium]
MNEKNPFEDAPVIFSYTRAQAIEDGVLVDLTAWAKETGFKVPVACTAAVWQGYVVPPPGTESFGQSERGRGHDLLYMLFVAIKASKHAKGDQILYQALFLQAPGKTEEVTLKAHFGPGDDGEPVVTIMRPDED